MLEIEIITTKKKLSKSIVKQLNVATLGDMQQRINIKSYGYYVRDLGSKYPCNVMIFKGINRWVRLGARSWKPSESRPTEVHAPASEMGSRGTSVKVFQNKQSRDMWIEAYDETKKACMKNHLIL